MKSGIFTLNQFLDNFRITNTVDDIYFEDISFSFDRFQRYFSYRYRNKDNKFHIFYNIFEIDAQEVLVGNDETVAFSFALKLSLSIFIRLNDIVFSDQMIDYFYTPKNMINKPYAGDEYVAFDMFWDFLLKGSEHETVKSIFNNEKLHVKSEKLKYSSDYYLVTILKNCFHFWKSLWKTSTFSSDAVRYFQSEIQLIFSQIEIIVEVSEFKAKRINKTNVDMKFIEDIKLLLETNPEVDKQFIEFPNNYEFYQFVVNHYYRKK